MAEKTDRLIVLLLLVLAIGLFTWLQFEIHKASVRKIDSLNDRLARIEQQVSKALILRRDLVEEVEGLRRDFCFAVNTGQCVEGK